MGEWSWLICDEGIGLFLISFRPGSFFSAFALIDRVGARGASGIIEDGRLRASVEPHGLGHGSGGITGKVGNKYSEGL